MKARQILALLCALFLFPGRAAESAADKHFIEKVKPLLDSRCISCHGADKQKAGLRLDSRAATLKGGESGPSVIPGKPEKSLLLQAVMHVNPDMGMPPKEKLSTNDIAVLNRWIKEGAPWPLTATNKAIAAINPGDHIGDAWSDPRNPIVRIFGGQRLDLWSLKPIANPKVPKVKNRKWPRNDIDRFVLAHLEAAKAKPAPEASEHVLARRLYFDLTGLPPTPDEMQAFLEDKRPDAYERLVDQLLASPRYGEHWARQWLDVIRYSDSNGYDWDEFRPVAWRFRDYVVRSFNADKPFDQFVREQLAGDELFEGAPKNEAERDMLVATGYLRMGPHDNSAPSFNEQDRSRSELLADLTETTSSAFLGLTMSCCRCHDHKYDPLSQADHYRLRSFFEPVKFADDLPIDLAPEQEAIRKQNADIDGKVKKLREEFEELLVSPRAKIEEERRAKLSEEERELLRLEKPADDSKEKIAAIKKIIEPKEDEIVAALPAEQKTRAESLHKEIDTLKKEKRGFTKAILMTDSAEAPPVTKVLYQGNYKDPRASVEPGFISALDPNPATIQKGANSKTTGRRLTLANWIVSTNNPLTRRVLVNRIWQGYFGRGLVATPNDFGLAGVPPTDPALLDWLALRLEANGWSLKKMHRLIVTSATYRQSSIAPLAQKELAAESPKLRRLSAEQLRDSLLAVSGLIHPREGGPPVWPELNADILAANPAVLDDNAEKTKGWYPSKKEDLNVRSLYLVQKRTLRIPFMETFDLPENNVSCPRRNESIVAPQALSLLNSSLAVEASRSFATRVEREAGADKGAQIERAFLLALQRKPDPEEKTAALGLLEKRNLIELCRAVLNLNEFVYID